MGCYEALAGAYDELTYDIDYDATLNFIEAILHQAGHRPERVLDLACGTGSLLERLVQRGYQAIGVDLSEEMLAVASGKLSGLPRMPLLLCQPMQALALPQPVDLVLCCLDSLNYLTDPADCRETFHRVFQQLTPGGAFVFDINTPYKLRGLDGQVFLDETEDTYCVWRAEFSEAERSVFYGMDIFRRDGKLWQRSWEEHQEYAYEPQELSQWLWEAGFTGIRLFGDQTLNPPTQTEQRVYFLAQKE